MKHHTKKKGDLGVLKVQVDLYEKGYQILLPLTEHAPFDLVAYKDGEFQRVQVKYRQLRENGTLEIRFRSTYSTSSGVKSKDVNKNEIDLYCIYCPDVDECYYIDPKEFDKSLTIRVTDSGNSQQIGVKKAELFKHVGKKK